MHRPLTPPERRLQRAAWLVYAPFASAWASAHCPARLAARSSCAVSVLGLQPLRRLPLLRSEPAKQPLWCNRSVVMIPFLRHPLSSGFYGKTKFLIKGKYFFDGGGEKKIKPSSSRCHRQGIFCFQQNTPPTSPRPPKLSQPGGFNRLRRFSLRPLCASFPL